MAPPSQTEVTATGKALNMPDILDEVMSSICKCKGYPIYGCASVWLDFILVNKLWAKVAIPHLWAAHAILYDLLDLLYDEPPGTFPKV
jgi:hypothetical protein